MHRTLTLVAAALCFACIPFTPTLAAPQGKVTGGKMSTYPDWFKESFLDITEDVGEATDDGKHVILFMEMNGCPYCFKMNEENFKHAPYTDFIQKQFDVIALNTRGDREVALYEETTASEKAIADLLKVRYTPTLIFLNAEGKPVARVNGYRNVSEFKLILDYVQSKAYEQQNLNDYLDARKQAGLYSFRDHPRLAEITDLSKTGGKPLAVLFEDNACVACDELHDGHFNNPAVDAALAKMTFVRLDALSEEPMIDPAGNATTPKAWAKQLGLTYRPGIVLFDQGKEIIRIENLLYSYHFTSVLEYVADRHHQAYPNRVWDYVDAKTAEILKSGEDLDISK